MAPRKPKIDEESDFSSAAASPLKPKNEKAKVTKPKAERVAKPKVEKAKVEKVKKALADGEKLKKEPVAKKEKTEVTVKLSKDGKEKVVTVNGDEAMEMIKQYLKEQNRPYSATEVSANLHGKVTKTVADKLLKELGETNQIMSKATKGNEKGSQWVFWALQDINDNASPKELAAMDVVIAETKESLPMLKANLKAVGKKWDMLKNAPTTSELAATVEMMRDELKMKREQLRGFTEGNVEKVTKEMVDKAEKDFKYWKARRAARKRAFENLEGVLLEELTRDQIWEAAGIEKDVY